MDRTKKHRWLTLLIVAASWLAGSLAQADVVTDWSTTASDIAVAAKLSPPPTYRIVAIVQTAVYEAVNAITKRYPPVRVTLDAAPGASVDAAVAAANRATLLQLVPSQQAAIDSAYQAALAAIPAGQAQTAGLTVGEQAAAAILAWRVEDGAATGETYRPYTTAGVYVPTVMPVASQWPQRTPWLMTSPSHMPTLTTTSYTAQGAARSWTTIDAFMQEVAQARIYDGVHYRTSTEVGTAMGKQIGALVAAKYLLPLK